MGGFECSTHGLPGGKRLDLLESTRHAAHAAQDFQQLQNLGIRTVRSGLRWHRIEREPGRYDFSCDLDMIRAAQATGTQVIWDLFHDGWPDFLDIFSEAFVERFRLFSLAAVRVLKNYTRGPLMVSPANEISFFAYAAGQEGIFKPFARGQGDRLKAQVSKAAIAAMRAIREVAPSTRFAHPEPVIHVVADPAQPENVPGARAYRESQYAAWDMLAGRTRPELGGGEEYLDILGLNFYNQNEWVYLGPGLRGITVRRGNPLYRPFRDILAEVYERYGRPMLVSETGTEGRKRHKWLAYIAGEVRAAVERGIPVEDICFYPITDYPGWNDERYCPTGLLSYADANGRRKVHKPLAEELREQQEILSRGRVGVLD